MTSKRARLDAYEQKWRPKRLCVTYWDIQPQPSCAVELAEWYLVGRPQPYSNIMINWGGEKLSREYAIEFRMSDRLDPRRPFIKEYMEVFDVCTYVSTHVNATGPQVAEKIMEYVASADMFFQYAQSSTSTEEFFIACISHRLNAYADHRDRRRQSILSYANDPEFRDNENSDFDEYDDM